MAMTARSARVPVLLSAAAATSLITFVSMPTSAQTLELPRPRQGYYLGGGVHFASSYVRDGNEGQGVWPGGMLTLRTGEMLTTHFGLGLRFEGGSTSQDPNSASFGGLSLEGQWECTRNLALTAGAGFAVLGLRDRAHPDDPRRGSYGGAYSLGVSYDWFPRPRRRSGGFALQPVAMLRYLPDDPVSSLIVTAGLEVVRWRGLAPNELRLPAGEGYEKRRKRGR